MSRNFKFESQLNADLSCPPIAARQKLDALGIKIRRDQWLALEMNERRKINDLPAESDSEKRQFAEFVNNIVKERSGELPSQLTMEQQTAAVPTDAISQVIADKAREHGFELDSASWAKLDYDQRYVLLKFGSDERRRGKFAAALKDFSRIFSRKFDQRGAAPIPGNISALARGENPRYRQRAGFV